MDSYYETTKVRDCLVGIPAVYSNMISEGIKKVITEFTNTHYEYANTVIGVILTGSQATGRATSTSDVDLILVHDASFNLKLRGNRYVNGVMVEYFGNPLSVWEMLLLNEQGKDTHIWSQMLANGIILESNSSAVEKLIATAVKVHSSLPGRVADRDLEMMKYQLFDGQIKLRNAENTPPFQSLYYLQLSKLIAYNAKFDRIILPATAKVYTFLVDQSFDKQYKLRTFDDFELVKLMINCYENPTLLSISALGNYTINRFGGFSIDNWIFKENV